MVLSVHDEYLSPGEYYYLNRSYNSSMLSAMLSDRLVMQFGYWTDTLDSSPTVGTAKCDDQTIHSPFYQLKINRRVMKMVHLSRFISTVFGFGIAILASTTAAENATTVAAVATLYKVQEPAEGLCRLQDVDQTSDNFKYYASVSAKTINDGCARCVEVHRDGSLSVTAYVLDVCKNCKSSEIKLSEEALSQLEFDPESEIRGKVTYKYVSCPTSFASGNVKACLMEGASNTYIPMQFSNTQKVITKVVINGQVATPSNDAFFYSVIAPEADATQSEWYEDIKVTLTWDDGETQSGSFAFSSSDGCATSASQFNTKGENSASGHAVYSAALIMVSGCLMMIIDMI